MQPLKLTSCDAIVCIRFDGLAFPVEIGVELEKLVDRYGVSVCELNAGVVVHFGRRRERVTADNLSWNDVSLRGPLVWLAIIC